MNLYCLHCGSPVLETASSCQTCHALFTESQFNEIHTKDTQAKVIPPSSRRTRDDMLPILTLSSALVMACLYLIYTNMRRASAPAPTAVSTTEIRDIHGKTIDEYGYAPQEISYSPLRHHRGALGGLCGSTTSAPCFALASEDYEIRSRTTVMEGRPLDEQSMFFWERLQSRVSRGQISYDEFIRAGKAWLQHREPRPDYTIEQSIFFCSENCLRTFWKNAELPTDTTFEHNIAHKSIKLEHAAYFIPDKVALYQQAATTSEKCKTLLNILREEGSRGHLDVEWENQPLHDLFAARFSVDREALWQMARFGEEWRMTRSCIATCNPGAHNTECLITLISSEDPFAFKVYKYYQPPHDLSSLEKLFWKYIKFDMILYFRSLDVESAWKEWHSWSNLSKKAERLEAEWKRAQRDAQQYKVLTFEEVLQEEYHAATVGDALEYACSGN